MIILLIDADACLVKQEIYRVAERAGRGDIVVTPNGPDLTYVPHWGTLRGKCPGARSRSSNFPATVGVPTNC
jgi:hypothetical protein